MRRFSLSTKLFAAALPLILAVGALLLVTVRSDLNDVDRAESGAELGSVWEPLITALTAVEDEAATIKVEESTAVAQGSAVAAPTADPAARRATDQSINELRESIESLGAFQAASDHVTNARSNLSGARRAVDMATIAPQMAGDIVPAEAYTTALRELVALGQLLPSEAGDAELGRELLAVVKLAEAKLFANEVVEGTTAWPNVSRNTAPLAAARDSYSQLETTLGEFESIAPAEWTTQLRQSGYQTQLGAYSTELDNVFRLGEQGRIEVFDTPGFVALIDQGVEFQGQVASEIVERANSQADATSSASLRRIGIIIVVVLAAVMITWIITRSVTRRVKEVAVSANQVADEQLPALVEALRDPRGKAVLPDFEQVDARGGDDLAELAHAFNSMQETLVEVAHEQVEVLRRGVSDIFVTMARRNRSLIDRQLAMLDQYEASVDDPEVLSNYYQLDHLATRMRRNSESLLVLANAEPKRRRVKATDIDDVVRASIGEVEEYRRIEVQHLEQLQVRGQVVADISHLLAELLDNATSFSPPGSTVRVGGRRMDDGYMIRIVDDGMGIAPERLAELNYLLKEPPVVGLSVEATLGMSVVSLLANKHNIDVQLSPGSPGLTVDVMIPSSLYGPNEAPAEAAPSVAPAAQAPAIEAPAPAPVQRTTPAPLDWAQESDAQPTPEPAQAQSSNWTSMAIDMTEFEEKVAETPSEPEQPAPASAEFNTPPAPPVTADGPSRQPVTPEAARPAPAPAADLGGSPALPTRTQRGTGPQGPDRLATPEEAPATATSEPGSLQAALAAFDNGRSSASAEPSGALPTRARGGGAAPSFEEQQSVAQSRVDPSALRDRLRAFQTEFTTANNETSQETTDLGGDPR